MTAMFNWLKRDKKNLVIFGLGLLSLVLFDLALPSAPRPAPLSQNAQQLIAAASQLFPPELMLDPRAIPGNVTTVAAPDGLEIIKTYDSVMAPVALKQRYTDTMKAQHWLVIPQFGQITSDTMTFSKDFSRFSVTITASPTNAGGSRLLFNYYPRLAIFANPTQNTSPVPLPSSLWKPTKTPAR